MLCLDHRWHRVMCRLKNYDVGEGSDVVVRWDNGAMNGEGPGAGAFAGRGFR